MQFCLGILIFLSMGSMYVGDCLPEIVWQRSLARDSLPEIACQKQSAIDRL
jgi:hypothetical protein